MVWGSVQVPLQQWSLNPHGVALGEHCTQVPSRQVQVLAWQVVQAAPLAVLGCVHSPLALQTSPVHSLPSLVQAASAALVLITHLPVVVQTRFLHGALAGGSGHWLARLHGWQVWLPAHRPEQH